MTRNVRHPTAALATKSVQLSRGVKTSKVEIEKTLQAAKDLQVKDPYALYALHEHALDSGYKLPEGVLRTLEGVGLSKGALVAGQTRAIIADFVTGHGLSLEVRGEQAKTVAVAARGPVQTRLDVAFAGKVVRDVRTGDYAAVAADLVAQAEALIGARRKVRVGEMVRWSAAAATLVERHGRARPELQKLLLDAERLFTAEKVGARARMVFFDLAGMTGAELKSAPPMPMRRVPYWQMQAHPLEGYQSAAKLPKEADVVIVGAGLTGGSAALHIAAEAKKRGLRVVMLDAGDVASQASGRNGGNLEAIPENFFGAYGTYDGYAEERYKFLQASYPELPETALRAQAQRIAETIIRFGYKNSKLTTDDIKTHGLSVDQSLSGWLRLALNKREERALKKEVTLGKRMGLGIREITPAEIKKNYKIDTKFVGRIVENNGNFHPFKLVVQEVQRALDQGVQLYTGTKVTKIDSKRADRHVLQTSKGSITAKKVIVATNAFTGELFPQLKDIQYFRSQIVNYAHVQNDLNGITFTAQDGDLYGNFPKQDWYKGDDGKSYGTLHLGGGQDTKAEGPGASRPTPRVYRLIRNEAKEVFHQLEGKVGVRTWGGPMAFIEGKHGMRMPVISELGEGKDKGILIAVWCNGYGSTGCHKTGEEAARWALTGKLSDDVPNDVFGVQRLLSDDPMFDPSRGGPKG